MRRRAALNNLKAMEQEIMNGGDLMRMNGFVLFCAGPQFPNQALRKAAMFWNPVFKETKKAKKDPAESVIEEDAVVPLVEEEPAVEAKAADVQHESISDISDVDNEEYLEEPRVLSQPLVAAPAPAPEKVYTFISSESDSDVEIQDEKEAILAKISLLEKKAMVLTEEIILKLRGAAGEEQIAELRERRRRKWDKIDQLERQVARGLDAGNGGDIAQLDIKVMDVREAEDVEAPGEAFVSVQGAVDESVLEQISLVNERVFHHKQFRGVQAQAIASALAGNDVFVLMPTGGGKSLCYELPGVMQQGLTVVVSPLVALINDQVRALLDLQLPAESLSGAVDVRQGNRYRYGLYTDRVRLTRLLCGRGVKYIQRPSLKPQRRIYYG